MIRMYNEQMDEKGRYALIKMLILVVIMVLLAFFGNLGSEPEKENANIQNDSYIKNESYLIKARSSCF